MADAMSVGSATIASPAGRSWRVLAAWIAAAAVLLALPAMSPERYIAVASNGLIAALYALAFNLLWNHARLLSFGHAAYFGAGMFAAIHLMRAVEAHAIVLPLPLVPLAAALAAGLLGIACGYVATARTGTYFAMITLAIAELVHSLGPRWEALFGGEAGLSTMRAGWLGFRFAGAGEVYYLVLAWVVLGAAALWGFGRTPLGRVAFALGDNELRLRFLGYRTRWVKTVTFAVSAAGSGLAGGLLAVANENVDYGVFGGFLSAAPVLHSFVGGTGVFLGPALGALGVTVLGSLVADVTRLWILYQGIVFVLVVIVLPQGIGGLIVGPRGPDWSIGRVAAFAVGGVLLGAAVACVSEATSVLLSDGYAAQARGVAAVPPIRVLGLWWRPDGWALWVVPLAAAAAAGALLWRVRRAGRAA